jgi:hypothetical protein
MKAIAKPTGILMDRSKRSNANPIIPMRTGLIS